MTTLPTDGLHPTPVHVGRPRDPHPGLTREGTRTTLQQPRDTKKFLLLQKNQPNFNLCINFHWNYYRSYFCWPYFPPQKITKKKRKSTTPGSNQQSNTVGTGPLKLARPTRPHGKQHRTARKSRQVKGNEILLLSHSKARKNFFCHTKT